MIHSLTLTLKPRPRRSREPTEGIHGSLFVLAFALATVSEFLPELLPPNAIFYSVTQRASAQASRTGPCRTLLQDRYLEALQYCSY